MVRRTDTRQRMLDAAAELFHTQGYLVVPGALSPEELKEIPHMPGSLEESLNAVEKDHEFLTKGDVFTKDAIHEWLDFKRNKELNPIRMRPTPHEFYLYFDI